MVFISAKYINGEYYYYLVRSEREGGQVYQHIEKYLGKQEEAEQYAKKHKLKMPKIKEDAEKADLRLDERIKEKVARLRSLKPISSILEAKIKEEEAILWTYNSTRIEGCSLTLIETRDLLKEGITAAGKPLRDHAAVKNHKVAIDLVESLAKKKTPITEAEICSIQRAVMTNIIDASVGRYRNVPVYIVGSPHVPPPPGQVPLLMKNFVKWVNSNPEKLDSIALAAVSHYMFETIHPFEDGNGRTGRLVSNLILMRKGCPPIIIQNSERRSYFKMLDDVRRTHRRTKIIHFFKKKVDRALTFYLERIDPKYSAWVKLRKL